VDDAAVHARKSFLINRAARDDGRRGHVTAAERLGDSEDVGLQVPVLEGEPLARAAEAGLHLVADEERAVLAAQGLRAVVVIVLREFDALALDQFHDEGRDVALLQLVLKLCDVAHRHRFAARHERAEALVKSGIARHGKRAVAEAVVGIFQRKKPRPARGAFREFQRALDGFRAAVAEENRVEMRGALLREPLDETFGEEAAQQRGIELHHVGQVQLQHVANRLLHDGMISPILKTPKPERKSR